MPLKRSVDGLQAWREVEGAKESLPPPPPLPSFGRFYREYKLRPPSPTTREEGGSGGKGGEKEGDDGGSEGGRCHEEEGKAAGVGRLGLSTKEMKKEVGEFVVKLLAPAYKMKQLSKAEFKEMAKKATEKVGDGAKRLGWDWWGARAPGMRVE